MKLFVYGTLLSNMRANDILLEHGSQLLSNDKINAKMFTTNFSYPFIALDPSAEVVGEIYEINKKCLADLDHYEGYRAGDDKSLFLRSEIMTLNGEQVIVYHAGPIIIKRLELEPPCLVSSGDWKEFVQNPNTPAVADAYWREISEMRQAARKLKIEARKAAKAESRKLKASSQN